jgi:hypothetical protein
MASAGIDGADRRPRATIALQHRHQRAGRNLLADQKRPHLAQAGSGDGRIPQGFDVVETHPATHRLFVQLAVDQIAPGRRQPLMAEDQRLVIAQRLRFCRRTVPRQIIRRRAGDQAMRREHPPHQPAIVAAADADSHVDAVAHQIAVLIGEADVGVHLRPLRQKLPQNRQDMQSPQRDRQIQPQPPARRLPPRIQRRFRLFGLRQDALRILVKHRAVFGQADAARGALQQPGGQSFLQSVHAFARRRSGNAQPLGRQREAAGVGDANEHQQVGQVIQRHRR